MNKKMNKFLVKILFKIVKIIPNKLFLFIAFIIIMRNIPKFKNPRSFNEKIIHLMLYDRNPLRKLATDRIKVRDYIKKKCKSCKFPKILWCGKNITKEVWKSLPRKCVIKGSHGSGMTKIIDKEKDSFIKVKNQTEFWLNVDYSQVWREWAYATVDKLLIIEEFLSDNEEIPLDFKFFCFNGSVKFVQVDLYRFIDHKRNLYNTRFEKLNVNYVYQNGPEVIKPKNFNKALVTANKIASDFDFIRVDLYLLNDGVYFGELTCFPERGMGKFIPNSFDFELGTKLMLNS